MNTDRTSARTQISVLVLATALMIGRDVAAESQSDQISRLNVAKDRLVGGSLSVKPNQAIRMRHQAEQLQNLIDAARAGAKLDPSQVDSAIRRSFQGF